MAIGNVVQIFVLRKIVKKTSTLHASPPIYSPTNCGIRFATNA